MKKVKIGVFGAGRGAAMMNYCRHSDNAELVAVCDGYLPFLEEKKREFQDDSIAYYTSFDEFIKHDMDAVVLANYATEHAPYAIRCLKAGKHVLSEVLPVQTMKEAVELIEAVESSGKIYAYAENYCYMPAPKEMRKLYQQGLVGEFEYGEGEYLHNCEPDWNIYTQGNPNHWRNTMHAAYYCTHSIGPLIHITGLRPVKATGIELPFNARMARMGAKAGLAAVELITLENGGVIKSVHGVGISRNSIWYTLYGSKGQLESAREASGIEDIIYVSTDQYEGENNFEVTSYSPKDELSEKAEGFGHGNSDFYTTYHFVEKILGNDEADIVDIYEAMDMFLPGMFAYRSILNGGISMEIPNLRSQKERDLYRNDTLCTDPAVAGDMLVPSYSKGNPEIPEEQYELLRKKFLDFQNKKQEESKNSH